MLSTLFFVWSYQWFLVLLVAAILHQVPSVICDFFHSVAGVHGKKRAQPDLVSCWSNFLRVTIHIYTNAARNRMKLIFLQHSV